jgi:hypothetical protein
MWEKMLREDLAENIAAAAFGAFRQTSYEAAKEAAERQRRQSTRN